MTRALTGVITDFKSGTGKFDKVFIDGQQVLIKKGKPVHIGSSITMQVEDKTGKYGPYTQEHDPSEQEQQSHQTGQRSFNNSQRTEDPKRQASIVLQSSAKIAVELLKMNITALSDKSEVPILQQVIHLSYELAREFNNPDLERLKKDL